MNDGYVDKEIIKPLLKARQEIKSLLVYSYLDKTENEKIKDIIKDIQEMI